MNRSKTGELFWNPFYSLFLRELRRFLKVSIQTVVTPLVNASLYLLIFGVSLGKSIQLENDISYLAFLIPGLVMMTVLNNAFQNSSSSIVAGRFAGDLEDLKVVPLSRPQIVLAHSFASLCRGLMVGIVTLIVGEIFYFSMYEKLLLVAHPISFLFFLVLGGLTLGSFGICVAFWSKSIEHVSAIGSFILVPLIYLGGVFFRISALHSFWQVIAKFNPVLYLINGVRFGLLGVSDVDIEFSAVVAVLTLVFCYFLALRSLKTGNYSRW